MTTTEPVADWASDYDIFDTGFVRDPYPVWAALRPTTPVPHTDRWGGSWMPTRYADIAAIAHDTTHFSSREITVTVLPEEDRATDGIAAPPITSDPPEHQWARRLILPAFAPKSVERYVASTRALCRRLAQDIKTNGGGDAAGDYAQQIPSRVIAEVLGVPETMADEFTDWVRGFLELGLKDNQLRIKYRDLIINYFLGEVQDRQANPRDDLISYLLAQEIDGAPVPVRHVIGTCLLLLIAGIDTTWSSIGSALWHLATHPEDRRSLAAHPELIPLAVEELLRAYSPVTMARLVVEDVEINGARLRVGDRVLLSFPAANRDPDMFANPDEIVLDRAINRHAAFGLGIHRCAGSNLARMEMQIALEEWLLAIPEFELDDASAVTWAGGQVRGPRSLLVVL